MAWNDHKHMSSYQNQPQCAERKIKRDHVTYGCVKEIILNNIYMRVVKEIKQPEQHTQNHNFQFTEQS